MGSEWRQTKQYVYVAPTIMMLQTSSPLLQYQGQRAGNHNRHHPVVTVIMSYEVDVAFPELSTATWSNCTLANVSLGEGKWYFECIVVTVGKYPQLGWADARFAASRNEGVGDDSHNWGCDGHRVQK